MVLKEPLLILQTDNMKQVSKYLKISDVSTKIGEIELISVNKRNK